MRSEELYKRYTDDRANWPQGFGSYLQHVWGNTGQSSKLTVALMELEKETPDLNKVKELIESSKQDGITLMELMRHSNNERKVDIKHCDIPNVCFSLSSKDDPREEKFRIQRMERGFDDTETWSLRDTIGNFIIPRLKRYGEIVKDVIEDQNDHNSKVDLAIRAFELLVRDNGSFMLTDDEKKEYEVGMGAYNEIFFDLWW
jgi:hypothetical protein